MSAKSVASNWSDVGWDRTRWWPRELEIVRRIVVIFFFWFEELVFWGVQMAGWKEKKAKGKERKRKRWDLYEIREAGEQGVECFFKWILLMDLIGSGSILKSYLSITLNIAIF
jgi:hypothetical protein